MTTTARRIRTTAVVFEKIREVYRPKGLLAFTTTAREYVRLI